MQMLSFTKIKTPYQINNYSISVMKVLLPIAIFLTTGILSCTSESNTKPDTSSMTSNTESSKNANIDSGTMNPSGGNTPVASETNVTANDTTVELVRKKILDLYQNDLDRNLIDENSRNFSLFKHDLNDDGRSEVFVGLRGPYFCGSGGCTLLLLDNAGKTITRFTVAKPPIVILSSPTKGWKDLVIYSGGKNRRVKFDGQKYPSNPSVQPVYTAQIDPALPTALDYNAEGVSWYDF